MKAVYVEGYLVLDDAEIADELDVPEQVAQGILGHCGFEVTYADVGPWDAPAASEAA